MSGVARFGLGPITRLPTGVPGRGTVELSVGTTVLFTVVSVLGIVVKGRLDGVVIAVDVVLFVLGVVIFARAYFAGAERSRTHELGIGGWFFLAGSAPGSVRLRLLGCLAIQTVVAFVAASVGFARLSDHPGKTLNPLAFSILVPILALACCGWWGARFGTFGPRSGEGNPRGRASVGQNDGHG
jgi:hypothetical protein